MAKKKISVNKPRLPVISTLMRFICLHPLLLLFIGVIGWGAYYFEFEIARPTLLYQGAPKSLSAKNTDTWFRVLRNHGFILGYSDSRQNPLWVEYALTPVAEKITSLKRPVNFKSDWRNLKLVSSGSYTNSGYERGHLAPSYAISLLYGKQGQADSFLMTNVSPQKPRFNQKLWQRLEEFELKNFTRLADKVWVVTGPVFTGSRERLSSNWMVEIPDAFYKIYITEARANKPAIAIAFLVPQTVTGKESLNKFVTSIDVIEKQTGLDFFPDLDDKTETRLESTIVTQPWNITTFNN